MGAESIVVPAGFLHPSRVCDFSIALLENLDQAGNARPAFFMRFFDTKAAPLLVGVRAH